MPKSILPPLTLKDDVESIKLQVIYGVYALLLFDNSPEFAREVCDFVSGALDKIERLSKNA